MSAPSNTEAKKVEEPPSPTARSRTEFELGIDRVQYDVLEEAATKSLERRKKAKPKPEYFVGPVERLTLNNAGKSSLERRQNEDFAKHATEKVANEYKN
ncbi:hypothetical protein CBS11350_10015 [Aspergillus niger]|nr:hypothetical protein CBS11350_10015 [Aspergillus niger]